MTIDVDRTDKKPLSKRETLELLDRELLAELDDRETSVPDEFVAIGPIRGTELYKAVQAVEKHNGGKLPVRPWTAWRGMLRRADEGQGEDDLHERYEQFYLLADTLLQCVKNEICQLDSPPKQPKRRGRKATFDAAEDERLQKEWDAARRSGANKSTFCRDRRIDKEDLDRTLGRIRKRRKSAH